MIRKATSSAMKVPFGSRKFCCATTVVVITVSRRSLPGLLGAEHEHEQRHEGQVDEVHALDQTDDQEHDRVQSAASLGLTSDPLNGRGTGQTVTDSRTDGTTGERQTT